MESPRILVREETAGARKSFLPPSPDFGWSLLGLAGITFFVVGVLDLGLTGYPFQFGNPDWEFGTVGSVLNGLPVPMLGLALLIGSAAARGWQLGLRIWSIVALLAALVIVAALVLYALNLPLVFKTVQEPLLRTGIKKSVLKTLVQALIYPTVFGILSYRAWRHSGAVRH